MKRTAILLVAFLCSGCSLLAQTPVTNKLPKRKAQAVTADPGQRLLCDPNFIWTGNTSTPGTFTFNIENPVPGYYYNWDFGDGETATGESASHTFTPGSYTVSMESYNPQFNDTCHESIAICVSEIADCWANFTWSGTTSFPGIYYLAAIDPQEGTSYTWHFGNGASVEGTEATYTYHAAGSYTVCLGAYNPETKDTCTQCINMCVNQVPVCWANFSANQTENFHQFIFRAESSDGIDVNAYYWDFGDGTSSSDGPEVSHIYNEMGQYTICLTMMYMNECIGSYCSTVYIKDPSSIDMRANIMFMGKEEMTAAGKTRAANTRVSPNPVTGNSIMVNMNANAAGTYRYTVFNARGGVALTGTKSLQQGQQQVQLDVQRLLPGRYWIEIGNNRQQVRTAFIKL